MLRPMAIAVIGSLFMSLVLSLIATPVFYYVLARLFQRGTLPKSLLWMSVDDAGKSAGVLGQ